MTSSPAASPRAAPSDAFGDRTSSSQRTGNVRRRSSSSSADSSHSSGDEADQPTAPHNASEVNGSPIKTGVENAGDKDKPKVTRSPTFQKLTQSITTLVETHKATKEPTGDKETIAEDPKPRRLSVAALIRSFSPRSRAKANTVDGPPQQQPPTEAPKAEPKRKSTPRITFGTLKRASQSFPASPTTAADPPGSGASAPPPPAQMSPTRAIAQWKQAVHTLAKDGPRLHIEIPPPPPVPDPVVVADESFAAGPGSLVDDVRSSLAKLVELLDAVDARKLRAIRLGGELRGLLGKAADEVDAYADAFRDHAQASVGVAIALQNLQASLRQVFPIVEKLRTAKFLLNRQFKQDVTFAFQEINSYYTSAFMELSMAVATRAGVVLPMLMSVPTVEREKGEEEEGEEEEKVEEPQTTPPLPPPPPSPLRPPEPTGDALCLAAHCHFVGHGCAVDYAQARSLYEQAAVADSAVAMRCLGHMYWKGTGVEKDLYLAEKWLTQATTSSDIDVDAWYLLGCLLCEKAPLEKTPERSKACVTRAMTQLTLAAERGLADAQFRLAELLEQSANQDGIDAAMPWYRRAAQQRHANAEAALGRLLLHRQNDDATEAIHWLQRAVGHSDNADALLLLGVAFTTGRHGVKRDLRRGEALLRRAVAAGSYAAMLELAMLLLHTPPDETHDSEVLHDEAMRLLLTAAQCGRLADADFQLGELFYHSPKVRDRAAALRFYLRAAYATPTPHAVAARCAATMVYAGFGCPHVDKPLAHRLYTIAADGNDADALNALGLLYEDGDGCDLDFTKAAACYRRAVELGSAHAHFNLGCLLAHGKGVARNLDAAHAHFGRALELGYALARDFMRPESGA